MIQLVKQLSKKDPPDLSAFIEALIERAAVKSIFSIRSITRYSGK
jgi:hypothetical protein